MEDRTAGFVGLGLMGLPMAANLLRAGWAVTAWNRSAGPLQEFVAQGGQSAPEVSSLYDLPVIAFMLPDLSFIEEASAGLLAIWAETPPPAGTAVVVMSSVSPARVQGFGRKVREASHGRASVVDAPVSGGTKGATDGTLAIMAGGAADDFRRLEPFFNAMGTTVRHMGPLGTGSLAKACNQLIVGTTTAALAEAAELAERFGMDPASLFDVLAGGLAGSRLLETVGPRLVRKDYTPTGPAKFMHKDLAFVLESALAAGAAVPMAGAGVELYAEVKRQGLGEQDLAVVRQAISNLSDSPDFAGPADTATKGTATP